MQATTDEVLINATALVHTQFGTPKCRLFWTLGSIFCAFLTFVGFVGNGIVVFVFGKTKEKTATMYLITNLAKADAFVSFILGITVSFPPHFERGIVTAVSIAYLSNISYTLNQVSIFFTTILVWQRYVAICKPHSAKTWSNMKTLRILTYSAAVFSVIAYFPGFFKHRLEFDETGRLQAFLTTLGKNNLFYMIHTIAVMNLISYVIPMAINLFASINLIRSLREATVSESSSRAKKELTLSVVVIVVLFMVFQFFRPLRYVFIWIFAPYSEAIECGGKLQVFAPMPVVMVMFNSSINYFIYVICAKGFRKKVAAILCRKKATKVGEASTEATMDTELDVDK